MHPLLGNAIVTFAPFSGFIPLNLGEESLSLDRNRLISMGSTVVHDFSGHGVNGMHGVSGKNCYDGPLYLVNNGKIQAWL